MERPLKRAIIKEEYVVLTGDFIKAVILNQFDYWARRTIDFDKFIEEEKARAQVNGVEITIEKTYGWIYKTAKELADETMLGFSPSNIRVHLKYLVENGWLDERRNPAYKWDKTLQYRFNVAKISQDLTKLGYHLEGWFLENQISEVRFSNSENHVSELEQQYQRLHTEIINTQLSTSQEIEPQSPPPLTTETLVKQWMKIHPAEKGNHTRNAAFAYKTFAAAIQEGILPEQIATAMEEYADEIKFPVSLIKQIRQDIEQEEKELQELRRNVAAQLEEMKRYERRFDGHSNGAESPGNSCEVSRSP